MGGHNPESFETEVNGEQWVFQWREWHYATDSLRPACWWMAWRRAETGYPHPAIWVATSGGRCMQTIECAVVDTSVADGWPRSMLGWTSVQYDALAYRVLALLAMTIAEYYAKRDVQPEA